MDLKDLYRDVILDHNKSPRLFGRLDPADISADGHNPLCGDRLHVTVRLDGDRSPTCASKARAARSPSLRPR
jgi:nitrogen fixation NifU-like protein